MSIILNINYIKSIQNSYPYFIFNFNCPKTNEFKKYGMIFKYRTFLFEDIENVALKTILNYIKRNFSQDYIVNFVEINNEKCIYK